MNFKKVITAGIMAVILVGTTMNAAAKEKSTGDLVAMLKESGKEDAIINVDAYRAAYPDLEKAFGDNRDAYIEHYFTKGIYEGRTKGALFNPLVYAEAYGDVKKAYGTDILKIVDHYLNHGITENRIIGTSNGCADIAEAEKKGMIKIRVQNDEGNVSAYVVNDAGDYVGSISPAASSSGGAGSSANSVNINYGGSTGQVSVNINKNYHHTTSVYDDTGLIRVEYYDENNKLIQYSDVTNYDSNTNSYTENVYHYDESIGGDVLDRTDTYVDGNLASSETT